MKHDKNKKGKRLFNKEYKQLLNTLKNLFSRRPIAGGWYCGARFNFARCTHDITCAMCRVAIRLGCTTPGLVASVAL